MVVILGGDSNAMSDFLPEAADLWAPACREAFPEGNRTVHVKCRAGAPQAGHRRVRSTRITGKEAPGCMEPRERERGFAIEMRNLVCCSKDGSMSPWREARRLVGATGIEPVTLPCEGSA